MVPVLDKNNNPMMPCSEKRARQRMERKQAIPYFKKGIFCVKLLKEVINPVSQPVALGIDPGSKREGYTAATLKGIAINITTDTKDWVKDHIETRRTLRRSRRQRKTPYRGCRENRSCLRQERVPPSTKSRWDTKLQMIKFLTSIIPISIVNIENIQAKSLKGKKKWNISFSPLEVGKKYFDKEFNIRFPDIKLMKTQGYDTFKYRNDRGFTKSKSKLDYTWEAHNVDSHVLAELALQASVKPYYGLYRIEFLEYHRRQLHVQNPVKGNIRKTYGGTVSLGMSRGSVVRYKEKLYYLGGSSKGKVAIHSIATGKRVKQHTDKKDIKMLYTNNRRVQFLRYHEGSGVLAKRK